MRARKMHNVGMMPMRRSRMTNLRTPLARGGALAFLLACSPDRGTGTGSSSHPVQLTVVNRLVAPVSIRIDGTPQLGLPGGVSSPLTVSAGAQWLSWTSAKPMDNTGVPIPDDIEEITVAVSGINRTLEISHVIHDRTYITGRFFNLTPSAVSIGVFDGENVSCAAAMPGMMGVIAGYTQIGYYLLRPATEIRAYRDPRNCTGPYVSWPKEELKQYLPGSGQVTLVLDAAP